jgi:hypothetical protein
MESEMAVDAFIYFQEHGGMGLEYQLEDLMISSYNVGDAPDVRKGTWILDASIGDTTTAMGDGSVRFLSSSVTVDYFGV